MIFTPAPLAGAYIIELEPFSDSRGWFARTWSKDEFQQIGHNIVRAIVDAGRSADERNRNRISPRGKSEY